VVFIVIQNYLSLIPEGSKLINDHVAIYRHEGQIEFYTASGLIFSCSENNRYEFRLAQGILVKQSIATPAQLSKALGVNRTTVYRNLKKYEEGGPSALIIDKSNRSAYKLNDNKSRRVQELLNKGYSLRGAAKEVGVTEGCIRYAIKKGSIFRKKQPINRRVIRNRRQDSVNNIIGQSGFTTKCKTKKIYL
jgi:transposase